VTHSHPRTFYFLTRSLFHFSKPQHAAGENSKQNKVQKAFEEASAFEDFSRHLPAESDHHGQ
jgi:hypothetical protein